jgi:hypothetical protein
MGGTHSRLVSVVHLSIALLGWTNGRDDSRLVDVVYLSRAILQMVRRGHSATQHSRNYLFW